MTPLWEAFLTLLRSVMILITSFMAFLLKKSNLASHTKNLFIKRFLELQKLLKIGAVYHRHLTKGQARKIPPIPSRACTSEVLAVFFLEVGEPTGR